MPIARANLAVGAFAGVAVAAMLFATRDGSHLSPDSVTYYSMARHIARGDGVVDFTRTATTVFPPGYPFMLAVGLRLHLSLDTASRALNALCIVGIVNGTWRLLRANVTSNVSARLGTSLIAGSAVVLDISRHSWSEPLFCVLLIAAVTSLHRAIITPTARNAAVSGMVVGLAFMVRFATLSLFIAGCVAFYAQLDRDRLHSRRVRVRFTSIAAFTGSALVVATPWLIRNAIRSPHAMLGPRISDPTSYSSLVVRFFGAVAQEFVPIWALETWPFIGRAIGIVTAVVAAVVIQSARHRHRDAFTEPRRSAHDPRSLHCLQIGTRQMQLLQILAIVTCAYALMLFVSAKASGSSIDQRTAAPLVILVTLGAVLVVDRVRSSTNRRARRTVQLAVTLFATSSFVFLVGATTESTSATATFPARARPGTLIAYLAAHQFRGHLLSNDPWGISTATEHEPLRPFPKRTTPGVSIVAATNDEVLRAACTTGAAVAWFGAAPFPDNALPPGLNLHQQHRAVDGTLYRIEAPAGICRWPTAITSAVPQIRP